MWPCDLGLWPFDSKIIAIVHPKAIPDTKFEQYGIIHFWVIMRTDRQTNRQMPLNALLTRLPSAWVNTKELNWHLHNPKNIRQNAISYNIRYGCCNFLTSYLRPRGGFRYRRSTLRSKLWSLERATLIMYCCCCGCTSRSALLMSDICLSDDAASSILQPFNQHYLKC